MKALSLTRPWPWIILHLGKRIENRSWETEYRGPVLLHAAKTMTRNDWYAAHDFVENFDPEGASRIPQPKDPQNVASAIVGYAELIGVVQPGWRFRRKLSDRQRDELEAQKQPCSGLLGLWTPAPNVVAAALGVPA